MNRLRNRLILIFAAGTLVPLAVTVWLMTSLLDRSLRLAATQELDATSRSLESAGRAVYANAREALSRDVEAGRVAPDQYAGAARDSWPAYVEEFAEGGEPRGFTVDGDRLLLLTRAGDSVLVYTRPLGVSLDALRKQYTESRELVERWSARDVRRGFTWTLLLVSAGVWAFSFAALAWWAGRISRPIHRLSDGLGELARGNLDVRLEPEGEDEVAQATRAFNNTAVQLAESRERQVHLTRLASWQTLARKMAHEVKNSLTPIRLTMEELSSRSNGDQFLEQAASIVIDEVSTLERRVRAFSEFASEPAVRPRRLDLNAVVRERIALLSAVHPGVRYETELDTGNAQADEDLVRSVLTNLLENAADAAGTGGTVVVRTGVCDRTAWIEVHDSGPGLSAHARESLFQPTISFKKSGMGLGLSIAHRSALMNGGDIVLVDSQLGGAAFRVTLPAAQPETCLENAS